MIIRGVVGATGIWWAQARDAVQQPTINSPPSKNHLVQNVIVLLRNPGTEWKGRDFELKS